MTTIRPFLMFQWGKAKQALQLYQTVFDDMEVLSVEITGDGHETTDVNIHGQTMRMFNSPPVHTFDFTPSFSLFVSCETEEQVKRYFKQLSDGWEVMLPLDTYEFAQKYAWIADTFWVSRQLSFAN